MRTKIIYVLFFLLVVSTFAVAQSSTSGSGSTSSSPTGSTAGSTSSLAGSNSGEPSTSSSRSGIQIPSTSGNQDAPIQSVTPSTSLFNSQNLNSTSVFGSSSTQSGTSILGGSPSMDEILSTQNDLISSTDSFLNPSNTTTNNRTQTSVLGQTIFGDTLMPGMTNIPVVTVVPSTGTLTFGTTISTNPTSTNPQ